MKDKRHPPSSEDGEGFCTHVGTVRPSLAHMGTTLSCLLLSSGHSIIDGKWVLIERIGKGGMGEVHRPQPLNLKRDVALKLISREFLLDLEDNPKAARDSLKPCWPPTAAPCGGWEKSAPSEGFMPPRS